MLSKFNVGVVLEHAAGVLFIGAAYFAFGLGAGLAVAALYFALVGYSIQQTTRQDIYIRFEGEGPDKQFVEVENEDGESISVGEWVEEFNPASGHRWHLLKIRQVIVE